MRRIGNVFFLSLFVLFMNYSCSSDEAVEPNFLKVSPSSLTFDVDGKVGMVALESNLEWMCKKPEWVDVNPEKGRNDATVQVNVNESSFENRQGLVIFSNISGYFADTVRVYQKQKNEIGSEVDEVAFDWQRSAQTVKVKSNVPFSTSTTASWLSCDSPQETDGCHFELNLSAEENNGEKRNAYVILEGEGAKDSVEVVQEGFVALKKLHIKEGPTLKISEDGAFELHPVLAPANASDQELTWSVSGDSINGLSSMGKGQYQVNKSGHYKIVVENPRSLLKDSVDVVVRIPMSELRITRPAGYAIRAYPGYRDQIEFKYAPLSAFEAHINYFTSSNQSVAEVSQNGELVCSDKEGLATIRIENEYSRIADEIRIQSKKFYLDGGLNRLVFSGGERLISFSGEVYSMKPYDQVDVQFMALVKRVSGNDWEFITTDVRVNKSGAKTHFYIPEIDFMQFYGYEVNGGDELFGIIENDWAFYIQLEITNPKDGSKEHLTSFERIDMRSQYH